MKTATTTATEWPENVIARCITAGGATVDILDEVTTDNPNWPGVEFHELSATCTAALCPWGDDWDARATNHEWRAEKEPDSHYLERLADLRRYAERHAEKCPWVPRPTV